MRHPEESGVYQIHFIEHAAAQRDALSGDRRELLGRGLDELARNPFTPVSQAVGGDDLRAVSLAPGLTVRYLVHRAFVVLMSVAVLERSLLDD